MGEDPANRGNQPRIVFLLGLQRCGSTWLANIFDSSPETLCFMEPFSRDDGIFRSLPDAPVFLDNPCPYLQESFAEDFQPRLLNAKRIFSARSIYSPAFFIAEKRLALILQHLPWTRLQARLRTSRHINFNRFESSGPVIRKNRHPTAMVIKELRLYGKIPLIRQWFPSSRIICLLRHPCALVDSVMRWFRRGRLIELERDIRVITEMFRTQKIGARYEGLIAQCQGKDLAKRIALLWRIAYESMVSQLSGDANGRVFLHEEFCLHPEETARNAFDFAGISLGTDTIQYLDNSSQKSPEHGGVTETIRSSRTHYREWRKRIDPTVEKDVMSIVHDSPLMRRFAPFEEE